VTTKKTAVIGGVAGLIVPGIVLTLLSWFGVWRIVRIGNTDLTHANRYLAYHSWGNHDDGRVDCLQLPFVYCRCVPAARRGWTCLEAEAVCLEAGFAAKRMNNLVTAFPVQP